MLSYASYFQMLLPVYCLASLLFVRRPLEAFAFFLGFRSLFAIVAYLQIPSVGGLPYFFPALILLFLPLWAAVFAGPLRLRAVGPVRLFLLFLGWMTLESAAFVLGGVGAAVAAEEVMKNFFPFLGYLLVYYGIREEADLLKVGRLVMLVALLPILSGLVGFAAGMDYSYLTDSFQPLLNNTGPAGLIMSRNLYGIFLALSLMATLPLLLLRPSLWRRVFCGLLLAALVVAQNRGTWIALVFAFMVGGWVFRRQLKLKKAAMLAATLVLLASPVWVARFAQLDKYDAWGQKTDTAAERVRISKEVFAVALERPLTGGGPYAFHTQGNTELPHNDYLRVAAEYGFPAMFLYFAFLASQLLWSLRRARADSWPYQLASCVTFVYLIVLSVAQNILQDTISYMLIFAVMAVSHRATALLDGGMDRGAARKVLRRF